MTECIGHKPRAASFSLLALLARWHAATRW